MPRSISDFPYKIKPEDLKDPTLSRLGRAFQYIWQTFQGLIGDNVSTHVLNGVGVYATPVSPDFPLKHTSPGEPGQIAYDGAGNLYWCIAANSWARIGPGGYSNSF